jgi:hypothetical protein
MTTLGTLSAAALAFALMVVTPPALAGERGEHEHGHSEHGHGHGHNVHGAPGPIAGAGLPILAIGYGVYWLVKRRRKVN